MKKYVNNIVRVIFAVFFYIIVFNFYIGLQTILYTEPIISATFLQLYYFSLFLIMWSIALIIFELILMIIEIRNKEY